MAADEDDKKTPPPGDAPRREPPRPPPWTRYGAYVKVNGRTGRPTRLTEELLADIVTLIQAGNYIETACAACNIGKQTWHRWLKQGAELQAADKQGIYRRFREALFQASAVSEARDVIALDRAILSGDWRAAAWRLERKIPTKWGRRETLAVQHTGADGGPIEVREQRQKLVAIAEAPETQAAIEILAKALMPVRRRDENNVVDGEIIGQDSDK